jgi:antitoxin (DNA-binding transcriptional repressor) of toxin-antitoxin stability system
VVRRKAKRRSGSRRTKVPSSGERKSRLAKRSVSPSDRSHKRDPEVRKRVFNAVAAKRRADERGEKLSLTEAARQEGTTVAAIRRFPQLLRRIKRGQPLQVTKGDTYPRPVNVYIPLRLKDGDVRTVMVRGYKEAQLASRYLATIAKVAGNKLPPSVLDEFKGVTLGSEKQPLLADWKKIKRLIDFGITIPEFYGKPGGAR